MFTAAQATASVPPPPPPVEERRSPAPAPTEPPPPGGLSLVAGVGNPEWVHVGAAYRHGHLGGAVNVGTIGLAHNAGVTVRYFISSGPGGPFVAAGATAVQAAEITPGVTPRDWFFQRFLGAGWQFLAGRAVFNLGLGWHDPPPRTAAPPAAIVTSSLLPHFLAEAGYAF